MNCVYFVIKVVDICTPLIIPYDFCSIAIFLKGHTLYTEKLELGYFIE